VVVGKIGVFLDLLGCGGDGRKKVLYKHDVA
jgi:hypothetical protein